MLRSVIVDGNVLEYELEYKKVKNLNLRVRRDGSIYVSANRYISRQQADAFVVRNAEFILKARARIRHRAEQDGEQRKDMPLGKDRTYEDGELLYLYGIPYRIRHLDGKKDGVEVVGQVLLVTLKDREDPARRKRTVERFLTEECLKQMQKLSEQVYPVYASCGVMWPKIRVRSMISRWGSCQPKRAVLTFARQLVSAPITCQEYVVVHEFTHFLQADHSPKFHALMTEQMPDWKERKKLLNSRIWV